MLGVKLNTCGYINFSGVKPPYKRNGYKVIPINTDPTDKEVQEAIRATQTENKMLGQNGAAFYLGEDLIVKKHLSTSMPEETLDQEIYVLNYMYNNNIRFKNTQQGCYALKKDGQSYLVSTRINGANPSPQNAKFTAENLKELVDTIIEFDKGVETVNELTGITKNERFLNYDFHLGNINVTPKTAGTFDFEYSKFRDLDTLILNQTVFKRKNANPYRSDTSELSSNIKAFEFYALNYYLQNTEDKEEAKEIFKTYLKLKSNYHKEMSDFFYRYSKFGEFSATGEIISNKELAHSRLLRGDKNGEIPKDILLAEAKKIQMAVFVNECSSNNDIGEINKEQFENFVTDSQQFMEINLQKAISTDDKDRIVYYEDAIGLFDELKNSISYINKKIEEGGITFAEKLQEEKIITLDEFLV